MTEWDNHNMQAAVDGPQTDLGGGQSTGSSRTVGGAVQRVVAEANHQRRVALWQEGEGEGGNAFKEQTPARLRKGERSGRPR